MKRWLLLALMIAVPSLVAAQTTSVSGTITDSGGVVWKNGTYSFTFTPSPNNPTANYIQNGVPFNKFTTISGSLDNTGSLTSVAVPDNLTIVPSGNTWAVQICPAATASNGCFKVPLTITGASQSITSAVTPPPIVVDVVNPGFYAAYTDGEIVGGRQGSIYTNLTDGAIHFCSTPAPCTWVALTGAASILGLNNSFTGNNSFLANFTSSGTATFNGSSAFNSTVNQTTSGAFTNGTNTSSAQNFVGGFTQSTVNSIQGSSFITDTGEVGLLIPGSSTVFQADSISAFLENQAAATNAVGYYAQVRAKANNTHDWTMNPVIADFDESGTSYTGSFLTGLEIDVNTKSATTQGIGVQMIEDGPTAPTANMNAYSLVAINGGAWSNGFIVQNGAVPTGNALQVGSEGATAVANKPSANISMFGYNSGGVASGLNYQSSQDGDFVLNTATNRGFGFNLGGTIPTAPTEPRGAAEWNTGGTLPTALNLNLAKGFNITDGSNLGCSFGVYSVGLYGWIQCRNNLGANNTAYPLALNSLGGRILLGTATDNGTDELQVSGSANISTTLKATNVSAGGITNATGLQLFGATTTCTTAASVGAACTTANINLPVTEPDTSYRIVCIGKESGVTGVPVVVATTNVSTTQFTITIAALTATGASFSAYDCFVGHN